MGTQTRAIEMLTMYSCCTTIFSMISQILMGTQTKSVVTATNYISNHSIQCCYLGLHVLYENSIYIFYLFVSLQTRVQTLTKGCYAKEKKMKHTQRKGYSGENISDSLEHEAEHIPDGIYIVVSLLICGVILETIQTADEDIFGHLNLEFTQVRYNNKWS
eukprot:248803_1